ncbi:MAG: pyridoxamine 5'-phosphate oxidase family protein, partial [Planctomycetes bacterium]|nr:pyridoxamine 5'-phosphate oxidase family protein [Planctomycetota bacterium]
RCDAEWEKLAPNFPVERGVRAIIVAEITRISDSCGYGVPLYTFNGQRKQRQQSIGARSDEQLCQSIERYNLKSIDGLPGLRDPKGVLSAK